MDNNIYEGMGGFEDILWLAASEFPDHTTTELLNLLSRSPAVDDSTVFFLSNRDPYAMQIYATLKFGSRRVAWASKSMACPTLQWKVPTIEEVQTYLDSWPDEEIKRTKEVRKMTTDEENRKLEALREKKQNWVQGFLDSPVSQLEEADSAQFQFFEKLDKNGNLLWDLFSRDPALKANVDAMKEHGKMGYTPCPWPSLLT
ncbi:MAG: hypothetical protein Q9160_006482 [Pyrenula sp. 1 TL-2023]